MPVPLQGVGDLCRVRFGGKRAKPDAVIAPCGSLPCLHIGLRIAVLQLGKHLLGSSILRKGTDLNYIDQRLLGGLDRRGGLSHGHLDPSEAAVEQTEFSGGSPRYVDNPAPWLRIGAAVGDLDLR